MIELRLPIELWERGAAVGARRDEHSRLQRGKPAFGYEDRTSKETHIYGARGEAAFAYALGLDWAGVVDGFREIPDVLPNWEVRTADNPYNFKVAPDDKSSLLVGFVLNERNSPLYQIVGYVPARWAQQNLPLHDKPDRKGKPRGKPAHWVKEYSLTPINPGFHATHAWARDGEGRWACAYCPERWEGTS
jgi:hypothetical protein